MKIRVAAIATQWRSGRAVGCSPSRMLRCWFRSWRIPISDCRRHLPLHLQRRFRRRHRNRSPRRLRRPGVRRVLGRSSIFRSTADSTRPCPRTRPHLSDRSCPSPERGFWLESGWLFFRFAPPDEIDQSVDRLPRLADLERFASSQRITSRADAVRAGIAVRNSMMCPARPATYALGPRNDPGITPEDRGWIALGIDLDSKDPNERS